MNEEKNDPERDSVPEASLVDRKVLVAGKIDVRSLPVILPVSAEEPRTIQPASPPSQEGEKKAVARVNQRSAPRKLEADRISTIASNTPEAPAAEVERKRRSDTLNRKALEKTNRGVSPNSRRFVRGILHPSPVRLCSAAIFAISVRIAMLAGVGLMGLFLAEKVSKVYLLGLLVIPLLALAYFGLAAKARCRVCGAKEFLPSGARKHKKTHRFLGLGPIISTALHLLTFKWFYCMFCGTAIRVKK